MEIMINNYPVDIVLEKEKTVDDVVVSISEWIKQKNLILSGILIDGEEYLINAIPDLLIENINIINCLVQSKSDIVYETVNEAILYCDRVIDVLQDIEDEPMNTDELDDLVSGIEWLQELFSTVSNLLGINLDDVKYRDSSVSDYVKSLDELRQRIAKFLSEMGDNGEINIDDSIFMNIREIFNIFLVSDEMKRLIIDSIDSPDVLINSLKDIKEHLPEQKTILESAAISYQSGNDKQGMEQLLSFINFMFHYTRTCYQISPVFDISLKDIIIDEESLEEKNRELQILLNETFEIMENNDMISLADILEYEIAESMENLEQYIELLLEKIIR
ncbi:MAG: hypothetical protein FWH53_05765 [Leptospirales bacterium]|nr:hypothetical protein [Leptospirales bacterium]